MKTLEERFPNRYCINLDRRPDRMEQALAEFAKARLQVNRFAAVDGQTVTNPRQMGNRFQYACQLSHRLILRRCRHRGDVLIFEDDVVLRKDFREAIEMNEPPKDWGLIVFGCIHAKTPVRAGEFWWKVRDFWGTHAIAVNERWIPRLLQVLRRPVAKGGIDNVYSSLHREVPIYSPITNLAWQREGFSDIMQKPKKRYSDDGRQLFARHVVRNMGR